ncbi:hypothetical protein niasHT_026367 [Heterodera trifolii]|uniref:Uncharacterized protein n=1 Tax=Heterodera trifolii TaxID=157864 RepID=A0ABD2JC17_9BILA
MDNSKLQFLLSLGTGVAPKVELATTESRFATATIEGFGNTFIILMSQIANSDRLVVDSARLVLSCNEGAIFSPDSQIEQIRGPGHN